jgi:hypothetical protein
MYFIVNNLDNLQTNTPAYSVNTLNDDGLHIPFVNLWYFQKDAYFILIKINSLCHSLRSITNKKGNLKDTCIYRPIPQMNSCCLKMNHCYLENSVIA